MKARIRAWGWILLVVVVVVVLRFALAPRPTEVDVVRAGRGVIEDIVTNSQAGTVRSRHRSRVGPEAAGKVAEIPRREGSAVKRGDVVLRLDTATGRAQLDVARRDVEAAGAALEAARASAALATSEFDRVDELKRHGVAAPEAWEQARSKRDAADAELQAAEAQLARARAGVRLAEDGLRHLEVRAPFDGVVTERWVEVGEAVSPGQAVLEIMDPGHLYVSGPIDEVDIGRVRQGLPARVTLDPYPGLVWKGRVSRVSASVDDTREQNRTLEVEIELEPAPGLPRPKPGTSADVEIVLDQRDGVLRVPTFSVIEGRRVFLVHDGRAVPREITVGLKNWEWTEVRGGLAEGDPVVVNLEDLQLHGGERVRAKARDAGAAGAAGASTGSTAGGEPPR